MLAPRAVLMDIEGTSAPSAFIQGVLVPFADDALADWTARIDLPEVAGVLNEVRRMVPDQPELTTLRHWSERGLKIAPLLQLQGMIWEQGYADGVLRGQVYPDVAPHLRGWAGHGIRSYTFSSGSIQAQRLIFGHSTDGDLSGLIAGFFDTRRTSNRRTSSSVAISVSSSASPQPSRAR